MYLEHAQATAQNPLSEGSLELVTCGRHDGPPLRFKGWEITRHERRIDAEVDLWIVLYGCKAGGFVVTFSGWDGTKWRPNLVRVDTLELAMDCLERECRDLDQRVGPAFENTSRTIEILRKLAMLEHAKQAFRDLVGHALHAWVDLAKATA